MKHIAGLSFATILCATTLCACMAPQPDRGVDAATVVPQADSWQAVILPEDVPRLANRLESWETALELTERDNPKLIVDEGSLLKPDGARAALPATGTYRCRTIKLGVEGLGGIAYGWFRCRIFEEGNQIWLVKETGSQRQAGRVFSDGTFLGGTTLGEEGGSVGYGAITDRNVVGVMERLNEGHYRLVQPRPYYESTLDIMELKAA